MSSLYVVGCGKENFQTFISFLQMELRSFMLKNNASLYNLKTLWKAESIPQLLKKNSRFILPSNKDATCDYLGFFNVNDWDALYSKLFSPKETNELSVFQRKYYTLSNLKSLLKEFEVTSLQNDSKYFSYDFQITYQSETICDSNKLCIIEIEINSVSLDAIDFFHYIVSKLDDLFPDVFLSACIDDPDLNFSLKFDREMLTKRILNIGKACYISNALTLAENIDDASIIQQYKVTQMKNGAWLTARDDCRGMKCDKTPLNHLLLPLYCVTDWSNLSIQKHFPINCFDMISIYFDKFSIFVPTLIFSRGYTPEQIYIKSKELGDLIYEGHCALNDLLASS